MDTITVCSNLVIDSNNVAEFSRAIPVESGNLVLADFSVVSLSGDGVTVEIQQSDDMENWRSTGVAKDGRGDGFYQLPTMTDLGTKFVRLRYSATGSGVAVVAARLHIVRL